MFFKQSLISILLFLLLISTLVAQENSDKSDSNILLNLMQHLSDVTISGQWFLAYQSRDIHDKKSNDFLLKRGYLSIEKKFSDNFSGRITQDISVDKDGDGEGDVEIRLKYGYLRFKSDDFLIFTNPSVEFGLVHRPWIDFEQKINRYRLQGPMFLDRNDILSSADYGITITTLLGGKVNEDFQKNINKDYPGKYGSLTFGIYNGGGYHAIEKNQNKIFEGRLSVRPLPEILTGLQFSYVKLFGKGNIAESPKFNLDLAALSYENSYLTFLGSYIVGVGDQSGELYEELNGNLSTKQNVDTKGYSVFSEIKINALSTRIFGRYDFFDYTKSSWDFGVTEKRTIIGIAYHFLGKNKIILDYDYNTYEISRLPDEHTIEFAVEIRF